MAHQVPHPVPVTDDDDVAHLSTGLGMTPRTLSFINNVQSAVAQIENRLATSPSAQPPPPSRHELPQTPPGPNDSIIDRVQFLESSLSLAPPTASNPTSHSDSSFAGAINLNTSLASSGAILSTAPPNDMAPNASTPANHLHTPETQPQPRVSSAPALETADDAITTDDALNTPASSIGPIVEQFETASTPVDATDHRSEIIAAPIAPIVEQFEVPSDATPQGHQVVVDDAKPAPIAPIVEHFETAMNVLENTDNAKNMESADEALIATVVEGSEALVVDDQPFTSSTSTQPNRIDGTPKPTTCEKNETATNCTSKQGEPEIPAESDVFAAVPAVLRPAQDCPSDTATLEAPSSAHEGAQSTSNVTDGFTAIPVVDHIGHITENLAKTSMPDAAPAENDRANSAGLIPSPVESQSRETTAAGLDPSSNEDETSHALTKALGEETNASREGAKVMPQQSELAGLSEDISRAATEPKSDEDIGDTRLEIADAEVSVDRPRDEGQEPQPAPDGRNSMPSELDSGAVMEATGSSELEKRVCPSVNQEDLDGGIPSSGNELNKSEEITVAVGDTGPAKEGESSNNHMGKLKNVPTTSKDEILLAPTCDTLDVDESTIAETGNAVRNTGIPEAGLKTSYEDKGGENSVQSSGLSPEGNDAPLLGLDSSSREEGRSDPPVEGQSPSEAAGMNPYTAKESSTETDPEVNKIEEDARYEEIVTSVQTSEEASRAVHEGEEQQNEAAVETKGETMSSVRRELNTQSHCDRNLKTNEQEAREIMAAKAVFARDKLSKFSLGSPVKKPHRGPFTRKACDAKESPVKGVGSIAVSPRTRRSPGGSSSKRNSFNGKKLAATFDTLPISAILDKAYESPDPCQLESPSASTRGTESIVESLRPCQSSTETRKTPVHRLRNTAGYMGSDNRQELSRSEPQSPLLLSRPASDNKPRLPRVAALTSAKSGSSRTPRSAPNLRAKPRIPRAATFSTSVPRSKVTASSPILGRKVGISSSPVTPTSVGRSSGAVRPQLRRTLSFTQSKPAVEPTSPLSRAASSRARGTDASSAFSLSTSASKPPRGGRPRFTVPEPFALTGPELHDRTEKQKEEARRRAAEDEARPRVFKPRPMPDFSKPYPKPK